MPNETETQQAQSFYYADGEKIPLVLSTHFVALRAEDEESAASIASAMSVRSADVHQPVQVLDLTEFNLIVLQVPGNGAAAAAGAMAAGVDGTDSGPIVYETPASTGAASPEGLIDIGELIIKFESGVNSTAREKLLKKHKLEVLKEGYPEPDATLAKTTREGDSAVEIANQLHEDDDVEYAAPNFVRLAARLQSANSSAMTYENVDVVSSPATVPEISDMEVQAESGAAPAFTPNDPFLAAQWGLHKIRAPEAWDISRGSSGISVAIIDEGGAAHEDYVLAPGWDARFDDPDPTSNAADGHGTACAGIAVATANNGRGISGVAPNCKARHIRIAYGVGGGFWSTTDAVIAAGVRKAVDLGADVLSNSFGSGPSTVVANAYRYAETNGRGGRGAPIAAATGNGDVLAVGYPAQLSPSIRGFLAVGASNQWDQRKSKTSLDGETWWGSNYGPEVDVVAPGVKIPTTDIMGTGGYSSSNYTQTFNGTSSATPHVAGLMALILSVDPDLRSWEVEDIIKQTAHDLGPSGRDNEFGFGRIDARAALEATSRLWYDISVTPVFLGSGKECYIRVNIRMYNPGINTVRLNNLVFRSHSPTGTVIDEFHFQPNPGPVMQARSGHDVRFTGLLLRANGTQASWSHRWTVNWGYTFWRPGAPAFALDTMSREDVLSPMDESLGRTESINTVEGHGQGSAAPGNSAATHVQVNGGAPSEAANGTVGDSITVDRATKAITIVIR